MSAQFESCSKGIPSTNVNHAETMEVNLNTFETKLKPNYDFNLYGIALQRLQQTTLNKNYVNNRGPRFNEEYNIDGNDYPQTLFISAIERNSPADR